MRETGLLKPAVLWLLLLAPLFFSTYGVLGMDNRALLVHRPALRLLVAATQHAS